MHDLWAIPFTCSGIVFIVGIGEEVTDVVDLIIQVLKPCSVVGIMSILWHIQLLKLIENHPFKLWIGKINIL